MRIGVLTLPLHVNYGGILQAYALQKVLQDMGHDVVLLDSYPQCPKLHPFPIQQLFYLKRLIVNMFVPKKAIPLFYEKEEIPRFLKKEHIRMFYRRHVNHMNFGYNVKLNPDDFDALIVGSDQIWRPVYHNDITFAYLSFAKEWNHVRRIAYAVSFGTDLWEYTEKQTVACRRLSQLFDAISVREQSGITLCEKHLGITPVLALDPTLLVNPKHYINHVKCVEIEFPSPMCLSYVLDETEEKNKILHEIVNSLQYKIVEYKAIEDPRNNSVPSVEQWLKAFYESEFIFTDSFHGCIFSIIFNKPFVVYGNVKRGLERFRSLLALFALEDRLVTTIDEAIKVIKCTIDWNLVNDRLVEWRQKSYDFLVLALSN